MLPQQMPAQHAHRTNWSPVMVSRRFAELLPQVEDREYGPEEACALMKKLATAKFVETAELHGNLNLDPKYNDQQIRTTVALPHGTGKSVRIAVLAEGPMAEAATAAGADLVGMTDLIESISTGEVRASTTKHSAPSTPRPPAPPPPPSSHPPMAGQPLTCCAPCAPLGRLAA